MQKWVCALLIFSALLAQQCKKSESGSTSGDSTTVTNSYQTSAEIGSGGGTISDPKGNWSLTIPAGALSASKRITVTTNATSTGTIPNTYAAKTPVLHFEPAGLTFLTPATLTLTYEQGTMPEGKLEEKLLKYYYVKDDSSVAQTSATVNMTTNQITAQIPHFSFSVGLTINIALVNIGIISNPVVVQNIANNVIAHLQSLPNDAARNQEFADNQTLLTNFINKLVEILGADVVTAAFPNADFDGDGFPNSSDPLVGGPPPIVTLVSSGSLFVSTNAGAINSTQFTWRSNTSGTYEIRRNGTNCSDGTVVQSGTVTANNNNTHTPITAAALNTGANSFRICATAASLTGSLLVTIQRDEILPVSSANPAGGTYAAAQNVAMNCLDSGAAQCTQTAYTTNGADPVFDAAGNVTTGTLVTGMWLMPGTGATVLKARSRDAAGNIGAVLEQTYANSPNITGISPLDGATEISKLSSIVLTFSEAMSAATLTASTNNSCTGSIQVSADSFSTCVAMSSTNALMSGGGTIASVKPAAPLSTNSTYKIRVSTAVQSAAAIPLATDFLTTTGFRTVSVSIPFLVKDINPGASGSDVFSTVTLNNNLYFMASDGSTGRELWKSDGTAAGTVLVKDMYVGAGDGNPGLVQGAYITVAASRMFFWATDGSAGWEPWISDGTTSGTFMLKDINPGPGGSYSDYFTAMNGIVYFSANNPTNGTELWRTDGTTAGTYMVTDINPGTNSSYPGNFVMYGSNLFFVASDGVHGNEIWKTDGTAAGTVMVKDINPGAGHGNFSGVVTNGYLYFIADDGTNGQQLWKTDGSTIGTTTVIDVNPGNTSFGMDIFGAMGGNVYFRINDGSSGHEIWKSDGTAAGTSLLKDINPGTANGVLNGVPVILGTNIYFGADNGTLGTELWKSDGTAAGTVLVKDICPGSSGFLNGLTPQRSGSVGNQLFFSASNCANGNELWTTQGDAATTQMVVDLISGSGSSNPQYFATIGSTIYFTATDGVNGNELWAYIP